MARAGRRFFSEVYDNYRKFEVDSEELPQHESEKEGTDFEARLEEEEKAFLEQQRSSSRTSGNKGGGAGTSSSKLTSPLSAEKIPEGAPPQPEEP